MSLCRAGIKTPLSPTASLDEGTYELEEEEEPVASGTDQSDAQFATAIRDVFAGYFVEQFSNYENFIIVPQQSYEQWTQNREQFQNFDKTAFISDQPANCHEFFSAFVESCMFTSFIDDKIISLWDPVKASQRLTLFDSRVERYRERSGLAKPPTTPGSRNPSKPSLVTQRTLSHCVCVCVLGLSSEGCVDVVLDVITETAPLPHPLSKGLPLHSPTTTGTFPPLNAALLKVDRLY